ncbi:MAG: DUF4260 domain-containing protein [Sandaracinus sp.]
MPSRFPAAPPGPRASCCASRARSSSCSPRSPTRTSASPGGGLFAACFLAPDLAFLGYLAGPRLGAIAYNTTHSTLGYAGLAALGVVLGAPTLLALALIGVAHVGFDRMLGYGLKYGSAFGHTHLGVVGRDR